MCHYIEYSPCSPLRLNNTHRQLVKDNDNLQLDHKNAKTQLNSAKLEQTKLEAEFSKLKEQYQQLDITSSKLTNQCEVRRHTLLLSSSLISALYLGVPLYCTCHFKSQLSSTLLMCHI